MKKTILILLLFFYLPTIFSQDKVVELTYSIVDTTMSQTDQVKDIYTWITNNISYDTKRLNGELKNHTPKQTINRKKALCLEYSELLHQMCNTVNIESYIIVGYAKGFGYLYKDNFTKSNHSWNIIFADTNWIIIDATWGSGSLYHDYSFYDKAKNIFFKNKVIKSKIRFKLNPTEKYFNIPSKEISKTHFPNDSKWQFKDYPISYTTFINDSFIQSNYLDYKHEISLIKSLDVSSQKFTDALNSTKFNKYNKFDKGYQYFHQASQLKISAKIELDSTLFSQYKLAQSYFDSSLVYLKDFKNIHRNFYKVSKRKKKMIFKPAINSINKISRIPSNYNIKYSRALKRLLRTERKIVKKELKVHNSQLENSKINNLEFDSVSSFDISRFKKYSLQVKKDSLKVAADFIKINKSLLNMEAHFNSGIFLNDSILYFLRKSSKSISAIQNSIDKMDEYLISISCKKLHTNYSKYKSLTETNKKLKDQLSKDFTTLQSDFKTIEWKLLSLINTYEKLSRLTGDNLVYSQKTDTIINMLNNLYEIKIKAISILRLHNKNCQYSLNAKNDLLSIYGYNGLQNINNKLMSYYSFISSMDEDIYLTGMDLYYSIRSESKKKIAIIREANIKFQQEKSLNIWQR